MKKQMVKEKIEVMEVQEIPNNDMRTASDRMTVNNTHDKEVEAKKWEFEKFELIVNQPLYISLGIFAIFPTIYILLRTPYSLTGLLWIVVIAGGAALITGAIAKHLTVSYSQQISELIRNPSRKPNMPFEGILSHILRFAFVSAIVQFFFFVAFVTSNIPHSFNESPRIESLKVNQSVVKPGEPVSLQAVVIDRDQDIKTYEWNSNNVGEITDANDSTVTWVAPKSVKSGEQKVEISVKVRDSQNNEANEATTIIVRESSEIKAMVEKLCLMAKPLEIPSASTIKTASFQEYLSRPLPSYVKIQMIQPTNPPQFIPGSTCDKVNEGINAVETEAEKKVVGEVMQEEIKSGLEAKKSPDKSRWQRWLDDLCRYGSILFPCSKTAK